jgi:hypothetical protein
MDMSAINRNRAIITGRLRLNIAEIILRPILVFGAILYLAGGTGFFKENSTPF